MLTDKQFVADALWRSLRTFCQTLYGLPVVVQVTPDVQIPWQGYLYASGISALTSLLQSIGRERVANSVRATDRVSTEPAQAPATPAASPLGCGDSL